jgi:hypothetical protein
VGTVRHFQRRQDLIDPLPVLQRDHDHRGMPAPPDEFDSELRSVAVPASLPPIELLAQRLSDAST